MHGESFVVCVVNTRCRDGVNCGVTPILFGWFVRVPSLHALVLNN